MNDADKLNAIRLALKGIPVAVEDPRTKTVIKYVNHILNLGADYGIEGETREDSRANFHREVLGQCCSRKQAATHTAGRDVRIYFNGMCIGYKPKRNR